MTRSRFWTRRCAGCSSPSPHTHHLTWWGRLYFRHLVGRRMRRTVKTFAGGFVTDDGDGVVREWDDDGGFQGVRDV